VPFRRCLFVVDASTNLAFLDNVLANAAAGLQPGSPNFGRSVEELRRLSFGTAPAEARRLIRQLADTRGG
jgi:hypothetical protein